MTRVIQNTISALAPYDVEVAVLSGEEGRESAETFRNTRVVPGLGYDRTARDLAGRLEAAASDVLGGPPDLWHVHNHSLGKNLSLPLAIAQFAAEKKKLLLQIHDFAEDGRAENYRALVQGVAGGDLERLGAVLYPQGGHVHYAPINRRDLAFLTAAGAAEDHLHYLPNAAAPAGSAQAAPEAGGGAGERVFLYLTRAIRRKNIGEFLLWSALAREGDRFAVSTAPRNPAARGVYDRWVGFAGELRLPVVFEWGRRSGLPLAAMMTRAHALVTTSVAEGFGLAFLEPWLARRRLLGRDLPDITAGIAAAGVDLSALYSRLEVPVAWAGVRALRARLTRALTGFMAAYGREATPAFVEAAWAGLVRNGRVDFGGLDEPLQEAIIRRVTESRDDRRLLDPRRLEPDNGASALIQANRRTVLTEFSLERYGKRLMRVYESVAASGAETPGALSARVLLDRFLAPERVSLLRVSSPGEGRCR